MNFRMDSKIISDPKTLTDEELLEIPLSGLSKGLNLNLSSHTTMSIYLRWLEIHRQKPSNLTKLWENTIFHWAQALRSRGFTESELVREVNSWKEIQFERNGPFRSWMHRYPPMPKDIARAYANDSTSTRQNPKHEKYKLLAKSDHNTKMQKGHSEFSRPPPGNYVCNRCEGRGHHLQVCPTNMDPDYDKAPGDDYLCPICHATGKHYKSLCPSNTDPNSINMKRRALGSGYGSRDAEYGRLQKASKSPSYNMMHDKNSESFEKIYQLDDVKRRLERGDSVGASEMAVLDGKRENKSDLKRNRADLFESRSNTPKPDQLRKKIKMETREEDDTVMTEGLDTVSMKTPRNGEARGDRGRGIITKQGNLDEYPTLERDLPERAAPANPAKKGYSDFVQKLTARRPEMSEVVNARKPRPAAADMWEESDMRRLQQMAIKTPIGSPFSGPSQSSPKTPEYFSPDGDMSGRLTPYGSPLADPFLPSTGSGGATSKAGLEFDITAEFRDEENTEIGGMLQPNLEDDLNPPWSENSKSYQDLATGMAPKSEPSTQFGSDEDKENIKMEDYTDAFGTSDKSKAQSIEDNQKQSEITGTRERHNGKIATVSELQKFGSSFKLKTPIPTDLIQILAKDPEKQKAITTEARKIARENGWK